VIDFIVSKKNKLRIQQVYNFPNPFQSYTNFSFEHNQPNIDLSVSIDVYDVNGQMVHQIQQTINTGGNRIATIQWNGANAIGRKMKSGIYIFRIIVSSINGTATAVQKLFLL
jgi:flagellar hook assembly protein FlgD